MNIGVEYTATDKEFAGRLLRNKSFEKVLHALVLQSVELEDLDTQRIKNKDEADYARLKQSVKRQCIADLVDELQTLNR